MEERIDILLDLLKNAPEYDAEYILSFAIMYLSQHSNIQVDEQVTNTDIDIV